MMCAPARGYRLHILNGSGDVDVGAGALRLDETDHRNSDPGDHGGDVRDTFNPDRAGAALDDRCRQRANVLGRIQGRPGVRLAGHNKRSIQ